MTKQLIVELSDEMDTRLRKTILKRKGWRKGVIKEAVEEALVAWMSEDTCTV